MADYYAVANGRNIGIFRTWNECNKQVSGFSDARFKKFKTEQEAKDFISDYAISGNTNVIAIASKKRKSFSTKMREKNCEELENVFKSIDYNKKRKIDESNGKLVIYIDGACSDNGDETKAKAGIGVWFGDYDNRNLSERLPGKLQTNNRAEVYAAIRAIEIVNNDEIDIEFRTDSTYLIKSMTIWYKEWEKNNWKNGKILNRTLLEHLLKLCKNRSGHIKWVHVKGHSGELGNEAADSLAVKGARMQDLHDDMIPLCLSLNNNNNIVHTIKKQSDLKQYFTKSVK